VSAAIVLEAGVARAAGVEGSIAVRAVLRHARRGRLRPLGPEASLEALEDAPGALVLARPWAADPGAGCLAVLARIVGRAVLALPASLEGACWTAVHAAAWAAAEASHLERAVAVACALPEWSYAPALPLRPWGDGRLEVPAVRPAALARWAVRAWRPCAWCLGGGGLPGAPCARCGATVPEAPTTARGEVLMAEVVPLARMRRAA